jgi:hypothetical protein
MSTFITEVEAFFGKVKDEVEGINWTAVVTYWQDFVKGLEETIPVIDTIFPGMKSTNVNIVQPLVADATQAVQALAGTVQAYQAGTLTSADAVAAAQQVQSAVVAANAVVGQAMKGTLGKAPVPVKPAQVTPVATPSAS